ncbi:hypothetical protein MUK42_37762 [Musa troglodytarum]|uniref:Uncharacterized protein n=1 Tax=Musa troglodytarum TaxID=320322 RepID=A0A9E7H103_9LILI|nr:hypothetical protein MUK42_37762 [Musa troglodytarum]
MPRLPPPPLRDLDGMDDRCDRGSRPTQGSGGARHRRWFRGCAKEAVVGDVAMQSSLGRCTTLRCLEERTKR